MHFVCRSTTRCLHRIVLGLGRQCVVRMTDSSQQGQCSEADRLSSRQYSLPFTLRVSLISVFLLSRLSSGVYSCGSPGRTASILSLALRYVLHLHSIAPMSEVRPLLEKKKVHVYYAQSRFMPLLYLWCSVLIGGSYPGISPATGTLTMTILSNA